MVLIRPSSSGAAGGATIVVRLQAPADLPQPPLPPDLPPPPPQPPDAPVIINGERTAPGVITIERDGKVITIDGATSGEAGATGAGSTGFPFPTDIPPGVQSLATTAIVGFCMMVAAYPVFGFLKALVNRRANTQALMPPRDTTDRLQRIEAAVEAMSVEVERISEGQRFVTKVLAERTTSQS